jgi:signal transduction histidine kinase
MLRGILINVINNAVRYSPEGGDVVVELKSIGGRYNIAVRNKWNGDIQITPLFFLKNEDNNKNAKTYIGLLDAKMIINAHSGSITIKNDDEEKATFVEISIPEQA